MSLTACLSAEYSPRGVRGQPPRSSPCREDRNPNEFPPQPRLQFVFVYIIARFQINPDCEHTPLAVPMRSFDAGILHPNKMKRWESFRRKEIGSVQLMYGLWKPSRPHTLSSSRFKLFSARAKSRLTHTLFGPLRPSQIQFHIYRH